MFDSKESKLVNTLIKKYKTKENLYKILEKCFNKNKIGKNLLSRFGLEGAINELKIIRMVNEYYPKKVSNKQVKQQIMIKSGRYFEDGFSGINIKNKGGGDASGDYYLIQLVDGEKGLIFAEMYDDMPTVDRLKCDALCYPIREIL